MEGNHLKTMDGFLFPADIDIQGDLMLVPDLHARITILDGSNQVVAQLGDDPALARTSARQKRSNAWPAGQTGGQTTASSTRTTPSSTRTATSFRGRVGRARPRHQTAQGRLILRTPKFFSTAFRRLHAMLQPPRFRRLLSLWESSTPDLSRHSRKKHGRMITF